MRIAEVNDISNAPSMTSNELPSPKFRNGLPRKDPSAYDQAMRYLAAITMLVLALAMVQPAAAVTCGSWP